MISIKKHRHYDSNGLVRVLPGCEQCRKKFEQDSSLCGFCGREVSNKVFLAKDSKHVKGDCRVSIRGPKIPERTVDKPIPYPFPSGFKNKLPEKYYKPIEWEYVK